MNPAKKKEYAIPKRVVKGLINEASQRISSRLVLLDKKQSPTGSAILWLRCGDGKYIARVALNPSGERRLKKNLNVLSEFSGKKWFSENFASRIPVNILAGKIEGHFYSLETQLPGISGQDYRGSTPAKILISRGAEFIGALHWASRGRTIVSKDLWDHKLAPMLDQTKILFARHGIEQGFEEICRFLENRMVNQEIPFVMNHGNYWLGNLLFDANGSLTGVVDWDLAKDSWLPMLDVLHLLIRNESLERNLALGEVIILFDERIRERIPLSPTIRDYCGTFSIGPNLMRAFLFFHWIQHIQQHLRFETVALSRMDWLKKNVFSVLKTFQEAEKRTGKGANLSGPTPSCFSGDWENSVGQSDRNLHGSRKKGMDFGEITTSHIPLSGNTTYQKILEELDKAGIEYSVLRDPPDDNKQIKDLDLLIGESSVKKCWKRFEQLGFLRRENPRIPFKQVFVRYREGQHLCLDLHERVVDEGIVYMDERKVLDRILKVNGIPCLSVEDELIHLVVHNFLRKGTFRKDSLQRIRKLLDQKLEENYLRKHLSEFGIFKVFQLACKRILEGDPSQIEVSLIREKLIRALLLTRPGNLFRFFGYKLGRIRFKKPRGGVLAVVGPDGSGKSTTVTAVMKRASAIPGLKIKKVYMGPWGQMETPFVVFFRKLGFTPSLDPWGRLVRKKIFRGTLPADLASFSDCSLGFLLVKWMRSLFKGGLFYLVTYLELSYRYIRFVFPHIRRGSWVVSDRYITDLRFLYKSSPIENYPIMRFLSCKFFPKPDLFIFLDNNPEVINFRKDQLNAEQIVVVRRLGLKAIRALRYEMIRTDQHPEIIADSILERIIQMDALK